LSAVPQWSLKSTTQLLSKVLENTGCLFGAEMIHGNFDATLLPRTTLEKGGYYGRRLALGASRLPMI